METQPKNRLAIVSKEKDLVHISPYEDLTGCILDPKKRESVFNECKDWDCHLIFDLQEKLRFGVGFLTLTFALRDQLHRKGFRLVLLGLRPGDLAMHKLLHLDVFLPAAENLVQAKKWVREGWPGMS